ncbi:hypothetical protein M9979_05975 [Sphingomonas sp. RP10(2022)]|uniref:Uncharacterized protein n=1 Tax=Sphingomonas liriopis TaxID=2949094 RepID=A0A9X2KPZ2_9SPHN|nr:hypothetical protein [Sphingomonas liriopis]MCP3734425.1 hypothetical protein [Sphingomonas liriopis]
MYDPNVYLTVSLSSLAGLAMVTTAGLSGWRSWLALKHQQLDVAQDAVPPMPSAGSRIEIADLKERIKKLEAIAAGVDL